MRKDRKVLYAISLSIFAVLLLAVTLPYGGSSRIIAALLLLTAAVVARFLFKKRSILRIERRQVLLLMGVIALLCLTLYYLSGLRFGFYRNAYFISGFVLTRYVLPITVTVVATEYLRYVLLSQNSKFATVLTYLSAITAEMLLESNLSQIHNFYGFMDLVGLTLLPAVTANVLYCHTSRRFGMAPNILYRLIIALCVYFIPIRPAIPDALYAFAKLLIPLAVYFFLRLLYEKRQSVARRKTSKWTYVGIGITVLLLTGLVMIVSCQFRVCALVIATESMTGELNKGDVTVYVRYDDQTIEEGQILVFRKGDATVVHRVIRIEHINGVTRYYTKGDANDDADLGYVTESDIIGLASMKIPYLGYPTLWVRDMFAKK